MNYGLSFLGGVNMAEFKSQYKELGFYVNGELINFSGGRYVTENEDAIAVLESLSDAHRVDEEKPAKAEKKAEEPVKAPKKPARKTSGK
jgi:hypothetical protein